MQPNKTKIALGIGVLCLGVSGTSNAATESFNISATTIADVSLVQVNGINFGANVFTTVGNCTLVGNEPTDAELQIDPLITSTELDNGDLSGTSCVNGADLGTAGEYTVTGLSETPVTISMTSISNADFSFAPVGVAGDYNGAAADSNDARAAVSSTGPVTLRTAGGADDDGIVNLVVDQQLKIFLGGTLNVLQTLTPNTPYTGTFDLTVTY